MNEDREGEGTMRRDGVETPKPRVLLVEDDPVSAAFLSEAIAALPAEVVVATTLAKALPCAAGREFDLWLIDAHLPDGRGAELLASLRAQGLRAPALAHTAETSRPVLDGLIEAGFEEVLIKPLSVAAIQGAVRRFAGRAVDRSQADVSRDDRRSNPQGERERPTCEKSPIWDDDAALRALNGNAAHVATMRRLFLQELPQVVARTTQALDTHDATALRAELHRLQASCGFVGAARLAVAVEALRDTQDSQAAAAQWRGAAEDTLASGPV